MAFPQGLAGKLRQGALPAAHPRRRSSERGAPRPLAARGFGSAQISTPGPPSTPPLRTQKTRRARGLSPAPQGAGALGAGAGWGAWRDPPAAALLAPPVRNRSAKGAAPRPPSARGCANTSSFAACTPCCLRIIKDKKNHFQN